MILGGVELDLCGHCGGSRNGAHGSVGVFGVLAQCDCSPVVQPAPKPCRACGFVFEPGADWGFLDGPTGPGADCAHLDGERECECCSRNWYRTGFQSTHDYELVGDPPRYRGGPAKVDCPECSALDAASGSEVANVNTPAGEPSRAGEAGASAPMSSALPAVVSRAERWAALDRAWLEAGAEIRAERAAQAQKGAAE